MWGWLSALIQPVLQVLATTLQGWWRDERAKQEEYHRRSLEGKIDSINAAREAEKAIINAQKEAETKEVTINDWNSGKPLLLLLVPLLFLTGCTRVIYVHTEMPIIPLPARPVLVEDTPKVSVSALMSYALTLEAGINAYNEHAQKHNARKGE